MPRPRRASTEVSALTARLATARGPKIPARWIFAVFGAPILAAATARSAGTFTVHGVEAVAGGLGILIIAWAAMGAGSDIGLGLIQMTWGKAPIDVSDFTQGASEQLLHLQNPDGGVVTSTTPGVPFFHFPYLLGVLLVTAPFRVLGDIRMAKALLFGAIWALGRRKVGSVWSDRWLAVALATPLSA